MKRFVGEGAKVAIFDIANAKRVAVELGAAARVEVDVSDARAWEKGFNEGDLWDVVALFLHTSTSESDLSRASRASKARELQYYTGDKSSSQTQHLIYFTKTEVRTFWCTTGICVKHFSRQLKPSSTTSTQIALLARRTMTGLGKFCRFDTLATAS